MSSVVMCANNITLSSKDDIFNSFTKCLREKLDNIIKENDGFTLEDYNRELHWHKLGFYHITILFVGWTGLKELCFQNVSKECTKLAMAYSKPPVPSSEDRKSLLESVFMAVDLLCSWFKSIPINEGKTQKLMLRRTVINIIECVEILVSSVKSEGCSESPLRLQTTGRIWKHCESFSSIPKDNKIASSMKIDQSYKLINDALTEIEKEISDMADVKSDSDDADEQETWTVQDRHLFQPCFGLIKAAKGTLKRLKNNINLNGQATVSSYINELDNTVDKSDAFVVSVDDLVSSLYPPVDNEAVLEHAKSLAEEIISCIVMIRSCHFMQESDNGWLDIVTNAVKHNMNNLQCIIENR